MRKRGGQRIFNFKVNNPLVNSIYTISQVATAINLYSAFVEDLEIMDCFFDFQDTKESPMKMLYPVIDLLVSGYET